MMDPSCRYNLRSKPSSAHLEKIFEHEHANDSLGIMASSHRYNLRSKPGSANVLVELRSQRNSSTPRSLSLKHAKSAKPLKRAKSDGHHVFAPSEEALETLPTDGRLLYQAPQKWTLNHLRVANVEEKLDVPLDRIVDATFIPTDDDPEFKRIANDIQEYVFGEPGPEIDYGTKNPFWLFFNDLQDYSRCNYQIMMAKLIWCALFFGRRTCVDLCLTMKRFSRLPLSISGLKAGKGVCVDGLILRISRATNEMGRVPLCVVLQEPGSLGMARHEIPQLLLQANMVFNYDQNLETYEAFLISAEYTFTILRAIVSPDYLRSIRAHRQVSGTFRALRTRSFDVTNVETRKEFLRGVMALGRYFVHHPAFSFPMRKFRPEG
ncbi:hypothetical protein BDW59DRAFT_92518 [Aspergillus cavernicola]|uniref:Fungal-type protein kinase domain-containing protein n=1 Tax=Aspergillus cavernicola TaxID=176166 RepID=A0ABR4I7U4_9EURO